MQRALAERGQGQADVAFCRRQALERVVAVDVVELRRTAARDEVVEKRLQGAEDDERRPTEVPAMKASTPEEQAKLDDGKKRQAGRLARRK